VEGRKAPTTSRKTIMSWGLVVMIVVFAILSPAIVLAASPVKIFLLIGESNMEGHGNVAHLKELASVLPQYSYLINQNGNFRTRSDVRIISNKRPYTASDLTVGYGVLNTEFFGPELGFGWTVGQKYAEPILLIKCAVGGTRLAIEWRSPSAVKYGKDYTGLDPDEPDAPPYKYGELWDLMTSTVDDALTYLDQLYVPAAHDGYEMSGIIWLQGWNDSVETFLSDDYAFNLYWFVHDLQALYGSSVPILIGELGQEGSDPTSPGVKAVKEAQLNVVELFASPSVVFVPTSPYVVEGGLSFDGIHHYYGRADTILAIGNAFGQEIIRQDSLTLTLTPSAAPTASLCLRNSEECTLDEDCCSLHCVQSSVTEFRCWNKQVAKDAARVESDPPVKMTLVSRRGPNQRNESSIANGFN
jgi:hypothetical protein